MGVNTQVSKNRPSMSQVHINRPLTEVSVSYTQEEINFVASQIFPKIPVDRASNMYYKYNKDYFRRAEAQKRAENTPLPQIGMELSTDTYSCDVWGVGGYVSDQARANQDEALDLELDVTTELSQNLLISKEVEFANTYWKTGIWGTDTVGADTKSSGHFVYWDDYTSGTSDPITDVRLAKTEIRKYTGKSPNTLVITEPVLNILSNHPKVRDYFKYTTSNVVTEDILAPIFGLDKIIVGRGSHTTAEEGIIDETKNGFILSDNALLCYVAPNPGLRTVSAGYTFSWTGLGEGGFDTAVTTYYDIKNRATIIEAECAYDMKLVAADVGYFFSNVLKNY